MMNEKPRRLQRPRAMSKGRSWSVRLEGDGRILSDGYFCLKIHKWHHKEGSGRRNKQVVTMTRGGQCEQRCFRITKAAGEGVSDEQGCQDLEVTSPCENTSRIRTASWRGGCSVLSNHCWSFDRNAWCALRACLLRVRRFVWRELSADLLLSPIGARGRSEMGIATVSRNIIHIDFGITTPWQARHEDILEYSYPIASLGNLWHLVEKTSASWSTRNGPYLCSDTRRMTAVDGFHFHHFADNPDNCPRVKGQEAVQIDLSRPPDRPFPVNDWRHGRHGGRSTDQRCFP